MAQSRDVVAYILAHYPEIENILRRDLRRGWNQFLQMAYLVDWRSILTRGRPLTSSEWEYAPPFGPFAEEFVRAMLAVLTRRIATLTEAADTPRSSRVRDAAEPRDIPYPTLTDSDKRVIDFVIDTAKSKTDTEFTQLVMSTYPMLAQQERTPLDLLALAREYKEQAPLLAEA